MKTTLLALAAVLTLATCGADGEPIAPSGVGVSGDAQIGVTN